MAIVYDWMQVASIVLFAAFWLISIAAFWIADLRAKLTLENCAVGVVGLAVLLGGIELLGTSNPKNPDKSKADVAGVFGIVWGLKQLVRFYRVGNQNRKFDKRLRESEKEFEQARLEWMEKRGSKLDEQKPR